MKQHNRCGPVEAVFRLTFLGAPSPSSCGAEESG